MIISRKCNKPIPTKKLTQNIENLLHLNNDKQRINYYNSQLDGKNTHAG